MKKINNRSFLTGLVSYAVVVAVTFGFSFGWQYHGSSQEESYYGDAASGATPAENAAGSADAVTAASPLAEEGTAPDGVTAASPYASTPGAEIEHG